MTNKCPRCGNKNVIVQPLMEGKRRVQCFSCGYNQVYDERGKKQLLEVPPSDGRRLLTETMA